MPIRITTLIENNSGEHLGLSAEHGISFLIESGSDTILFDTGKSPAFLDNARQLNFDLANQVTQIALSHGHYDHTGGLLSLLETCKSVPIHVGSGFFAPKFARNEITQVYLGNGFTSSDLITRGHKIEEHKDNVTEIADGIFVITNFIREADPLWLNPRFIIPSEGALKPTGSWVVDNFDDEISLVVRTKQGLVLLVGCSHPGILNIIDTVEKRFSEPLWGVIGGTHLVEATGDRFEKAIQSLTSRENVYLGMSHCTGTKAMERLALESNHYFHNYTGVQLLLE